MTSKLRFLIALAMGLVLAGCSTVDSRIAGHRSEFDSWPPPIQEQVRAGRINVGFTMEQVRVALGNPDYAIARTTTKGSHEVWSYRNRGPWIGVGVGTESFRGGTAVGTGISASTGGYRGERLRVTFDASGHVSEIEQVTH